MKAFQDRRPARQDCEPEGWVERSDTLQFGVSENDGFREGLYPSYALIFSSSAILASAIDIT
jgi:hypothetical protein